MNIKTLVVGIVRANCYLVWNDLACVLIDPGDDAERIETALQQLGKPFADPWPLRSCRSGKSVERALSAGAGYDWCLGRRTLVGTGASV